MPRGSPSRPKGAVSGDLSTWRVPCLICVGAGRRDARRRRGAAAEIPGATFVSLAGHSHISAFYEADAVLLPHILDLLRSTTPES